MKCSRCNRDISDDSVFCSYCGTRIEKTPPSYTSYTSPYAYVPSNNSTRQYTHTTYASHSTPIKKKDDFPKGKLAMVIAIFVTFIIIVVNGFSNMDSDKNSDIDSNLTPVSEPRSGTILSGVESYDASKITIFASSGESCVVKLKNSSDVEVLSFYVRAGETVTVGVPKGYFYVLFASGKTWYGKDDLFGKNTSYSKDDEIQNFAKYTLKYTLYPVTDGNFSQTPIDENEFK